MEEDTRVLLVLRKNGKTNMKTYQMFKNNAEKVHIPKIPCPLEWGAPTFDAGHAFGMVVTVSLIS